MSYTIGRKFSVGVAHETTRGTYKAAEYWLPKTALTLDDSIDYVTDDSSVNTISDADNQEITSTRSKGSLTGLVSETTIGVFILATLGTETSHGVHSGETTVYDHVFTVAETAQHESLSFSVSGANESTGLAYSRSVVDQLEFDIEVEKYITYKVDFIGDKNASQTTTPAFQTTEYHFRPQDGVVKFASAQSGLTGASAIKVRKAIVTIKKNVEEDLNVGSTTATDRVNKQFSIDGSLELVYNDRTYIDTDMLGDLAQAMRISAVNTTVTYGVAANPAIQIDLYKVKLQEVARKIDNNSIITQTVKFKAFYSLPDAKMAVITVTNQKSSAY